MFKLSMSIERLWQASVEEKIPLVLWGAGERGEYYLSLVKMIGIDPVCFGDTDHQKTRGDVFFKRLPIYNAADIMKKFGRVNILLTVRRTTCADALNTLSNQFGEFAGEVFLLDDSKDAAPHDRFAMFQNRLRLKRTDFTIISNTCTAGEWYKYLGIAPNTPITKCFIYPAQYLKLLGRLKEYLTHKLEFAYWGIVPQLTYSVVYPVGRLDDIEVHFMHDKDFDSAALRWEAGLKRVNWDNLFILFDDAHFPLSRALAEKFDALPHENKIFFTRYDYRNLRSVCRYDPTMLWPAALNHNSYIRYDRIDLIRWLNEGGQGREYEATSVMDGLPEEYVDWLYNGGASINYDRNDLMLRPIGGLSRLGVQEYP